MQIAAITTVRKFNAAGSCSRLGVLVGESPKFWTYSTPKGEKRVAKDGMAHVAPCRSCRDHAETNYPSDAVLSAEAARLREVRS